MSVAGTTSVDTSQVIEHFFRNEYAKTLAQLSHKFGIENLDLIEDAVQESLYKATKIWPFKTIPGNPSGWIYRVAHNYLIDRLKKDKKLISAEIHSSVSEYPEGFFLPQEIEDGQLRMMFAICNPAISKETQIILALKLLSGFGVGEIAAALLKREDAVAKAITRGKAVLKEHPEFLQVPVGNQLTDRLNAVIMILYLMFNEGYNTSKGNQLLNFDICNNAIALAVLLSKNKYCNSPALNALIALMYFQASRFSARTDENGNFIPLEKQDRRLWDIRMINNGHRYLEASAMGDELTVYHIQAAIAYNHSSSANFQATNWKQILALYNAYMQIEPSPVVQLNRIVAYTKVAGPALALEEFNKIDPEPLQNYYLYYAIKGDLLEALGYSEQAGIAFSKALDLTENEVEKEYLRQKTGKK